MALLDAQLFLHLRLLLLEGLDLTLRSGDLLLDALELLGTLLAGRGGDAQLLNRRPRRLEPGARALRVSDVPPSAARMRAAGAPFRRRRPRRPPSPRATFGPARA
eukprot:6213084-Pyramimonas_sp.AAC.1